MATTPPIIDLPVLDIKPLVIADLTTETLAGAGVFDVLMRANRAHLEEEFKLGRIKGPEYSTVYLGMVSQVMATAMQFLLNGPKAALEAQLLQVQVQVAKVEILKAQVELEIAQMQLLKIPAEIALLEKQALQVAAQTGLTNQQTLNAVTENTVLIAQECKLRAEYDLLVQSIQKSAQEIILLGQKVVTEKAQTTDVDVAENSVVGRQKALYKAQTDGFTRDAEQKAAKTLIDTWNVRRTTDEGTVADGTNMLSDVVIGRVVTKLLNGVGA